MDESKSLTEEGTSGDVLPGIICQENMETIESTESREVTPNNSFSSIIAGEQSSDAQSINVNIASDDLSSIKAGEQLSDEQNMNVNNASDVLSRPIMSSEKHGLTSFGALALLQQYSDASGTDSSSDSSSEEEQEDIQIQIVGQYRQPDASSIAAESSSSESDEDSSSESAKEKEIIVEPVNPKKLREKAPRVYGELLLDDLPPIEDLTISVAEADCISLGKIFSVVDTLVVIHAFPFTPALNVDTILFLDQGHTSLGRVFDVFGQVTEPFYAVRFNSPEHITQKGIKVDMQVYCAPRTEHTSLVFLDDLRKIKGSDASWEHDIEPPPECIDYSDDEQERQAKKERAAKKHSQGATAGSTEEENETGGKKHRGVAPSTQQRKSRSFKPRGRGRAVPHVRPPPHPGNNPFYMRPPPRYVSQQPFPFHPPPPQFQYPNWPPAYATPTPPGIAGANANSSLPPPFSATTPPPRAQGSLPGSTYNTNHNAFTGYYPYSQPPRPPF